MKALRPSKLRELGLLLQLLSRSYPLLVWLIAGLLNNLLPDGTCAEDVVTFLLEKLEVLLVTYHALDVSLAVFAQEPTVDECFDVAFQLLHSLRLLFHNGVTSLQLVDTG